MLVCKGYERRELAIELDPDAVAVIYQPNPVDQRSNSLRGFCSGSFGVERICQVCDFSTINFGDIRMEPRDGFGDAGHSIVKVDPSVFERADLIGTGQPRIPRYIGVQDCRELPLYQLILLRAPPEVDYFGSLRGQLGVGNPRNIWNRKCLEWGKSRRQANVRFTPHNGRSSFEGIQVGPIRGC